MRIMESRADSIGCRNTQISEVCGVATEDWRRKTGDAPEGVRRQWRADRALRPAMRSPGRPDPSRVVQRQFWRVIATGVTTAEAAIQVGVSVPVGSRWFRHAGGMPPISLSEPTGRYLTFEEREEIAILTAKGAGVREVARALQRDPGTISRELRRNAATRSGEREYRATVAQWKAQQAAKRPNVKPRFWWRVGYLALRVSRTGSGTLVAESWWAARNACGVRPPRERCGRKVLNQWTHSAVAISTSSMPRQGPRFRMTSALNSEFRASARALS